MRISCSPESGNRLPMIARKDCCVKVTKSNHQSPLKYLILPSDLLSLGINCLVNYDNNNFQSKFVCYFQTTYQYSMNSGHFCWTSIDYWKISYFGQILNNGHQIRVKASPAR